MPAALEAGQLRHALTQLRTAHPVLDARTRDGQLWVGESAGADCLRVQTPEGELEAAAEQAFDQALSRLDPAAGVMMQAVLLQGDGRSQGLVLTIHHLATDGVSWRILLEELRQLAEAAMHGETPTLPAEETSLYEWSRWLREDSTTRTAELPFWRAMLADGAPRLGTRALDVEHDRPAALRERRMLLDGELTAALLATLPHSYRANVEEIILSALALACRQHFGAAQLRVGVESHGRADVGANDLARTLGWLTAEYPLLIPLDDAPAHQAVRAVKGVLRAVRDRGIGYGQLRYLHPQHRLS
ncbi:Linear gramicidin synthase subunit B [Serratia rubidaea]|uniref:Linear gramicidin synthase subunit B n=1 Tax=Serratia rubidaea TaxID=61652 RepID=A0A3S4JYQ0_SERRU|nr:Linear gramicidin synthase subunit B [Serratia rubidaea]